MKGAWGREGLTLTDEEAHGAAAYVSECRQCHGVWSVVGEGGPMVHGGV